jgi:hypothetical protein
MNHKLSYISGQKLIQRTNAHDFSALDTHLCRGSISTQSHAYYKKNCGKCPERILCGYFVFFIRHARRLKIEEMYPSTELVSSNEIIKQVQKKLKDNLSE